MKKLGIGLLIIGAGIVYTIFFGNGFIPKSEITGICDIVGLVTALSGAFLVSKSMSGNYVCYVCNEGLTCSSFKLTKGKRYKAIDSKDGTVLLEGDNKRILLLCKNNSPYEKCRYKLKPGLKGVI